ncbi:phage late control D family protein [Methylobacterium oxalidis]|uniref:Uncharacterized protein n=1 Tax=Methylobacterium oxalidis TaxID=944322 RepID=A0A512J148_9HYPH|nr:hypothetical protein [Methylobacterium oxalidis]GEP03696.1 hypothetical protein MOX02_17340 [Methylobacterium oxalidis]GJE33698.1 hypothetical protein LDDCCGHA_3901 [Methylobacterium oxalidis]GLS62280.1 hypothetical protein GCM10007888_06610 [Methylobacterium oxalidis]
MPTGYKPIFEIWKGGENITARFQDRAVHIAVELAAGGGSQDSIEITVDDRDWLVATPRVKDRIVVYLGYEGIGTSWMGSFEVNSVRFSFPPKSIAVRGTSASSLNDLKTHTIQEFKDKTAEEILAEAGSKIGMKVDVHPSIADQKIPFLNSVTSMGSLVERLESHYGAVAKITDGRVILTPRAGGRSVSDIAMPTLVLREYSFADLEILTDSRGETARTIAQYKDGDGNTKTVETKSNIPDLDTEASHTIGNIFNSQAEAEAAAKSVQATLDRSTGRIHGTLAEGDPWLRDGQRVVISGIRDGIDGSYVLDMVRHEFTKQGALRTSFSGTAGIDGLAAEFGSSTCNDPAFIVPGAGQVMGQVLPPAGALTLDRTFGPIPALTGTAPPVP